MNTRKTLSLVSVAVLLFPAWSLKGDGAIDWDYRVDSITVASGSYFDLGVTPGSTPGFELGFNTDTTTIDPIATGTSEAGCLVFNKDGAAYYMRYGTQAHGGALSGATPNTPHIVAVKNAEFYTDGEERQSYSVPSSFVAKNLQMPGSRFRGKITYYFAKVWDGDTLVRDLIPCVYHAQPAFYDRVSKTFLLPSGSGTVVVGNAIGDEPSPGWDYRTNAVKIDGGGYFDTGIAPSSAPTVSMKLSVPKNDSICLDIFGTKTAMTGCLILNVDRKYFYYRYGGSSHGGKSSLVIPFDQPFQLFADANLYIDGENCAKGGSDTFGSVTEHICIPGQRFSWTETVYSFEMSMSGQTVCSLVPCVKDGVAQFYDAVGRRFIVGSATGTYTAIGFDPRFDEYLTAKCWNGASGADWSDLASWTNSFANTPSSLVRIVELNGDRTISISGDLTSDVLRVIGEGVLTFTGSGSLAFNSLELEDGVTLNLDASVVLGAVNMSHDGSQVARGIYTGSGSRGSALTLLTGPGELRVGGGWPIPSRIAEADGTGWFVFGDPNGEVTRDANNSFGISLHTIKGERPIWSDYVFPVGAKLKLRGYILLETIPSEWFSEYDFTELKYTMLHGTRIFSDDTLFVLPKGSDLRFQPGNWQADNDKFCLTSDGSGDCASDIQIDGRLCIHGDGTQLSQQMFTGKLTGTGEIRLDNFAKQFWNDNAVFSFQGSASFNSDCGGILAFLCDSVIGEMTKVSINACDGAYEAHGSHFATSGVVFAPRDNATTTEGSLVIQNLSATAKMTSREGNPPVRTGSTLAVWGGNSLRVKSLTGSVHVIGSLKDQVNENGYWGKLRNRSFGVGNVSFDKIAGSTATLYLATNVNVIVGDVTCPTVFDCSRQSGTANERTLMVTGSCNVGSVVLANDAASLPARLSGFTGSVRMSAAESAPLDVTLTLGGTETSYNDCGCVGSGTLTEAPSTGSLNVVTRLAQGADKPVRGRYGVVNFTSGGELLKDWAVTLNGSTETRVEQGGLTLDIRKNDKGIWLYVMQPGLSVILR